LERLRCVTEQTLHGYAVAVHGIKGSSQGICADAIGLDAKRLEQSAKDGDFGFVNENNEGFIKDVEQLINNISEKLQSLSLQNPKPLMRAPDPFVLASLREACEDFNIDKVDAIMEELNQYDYENNTELIEWLKEKVTVTDLRHIADHLKDYTSFIS
jgi:hypothetical protein